MVANERCSARATTLRSCTLFSYRNNKQNFNYIYFYFLVRHCIDNGRAWAWQYVRVSFFPSSLFSFFSFFYYLFLIAFDALSISSDAKFTFEQRMKHKRVEKCEIQLSNIYGVHEQSQGFDVGALQWYGCAFIPEYSHVHIMRLWTLVLGASCLQQKAQLWVLVATELVQDNSD